MRSHLAGDSDYPVNGLRLHTEPYGHLWRARPPARGPEELGCRHSGGRGVRIPRGSRQPGGLRRTWRQQALDEQLRSPDEVMAIGVRLVNKLRVQKVESVGDHEDEHLSESIESQLEEGNKKESVFESINKLPLYIESAKKFREAVQEGDLLPYYRYLNSTSYTSADVAQWGAFFRTHFAGDRSNVALWELRNLNIASHIRRATALHPGKRMLVIIGAAHKPFLEAYLCQMIDVKLVALEDIVPRGDPPFAE